MRITMQAPETKYLLAMLENARREILELAKQEFFAKSPNFKEAVSSIILDLESRYLLEQKPDGYQEKLAYLTKIFEEVHSWPKKKAEHLPNLLPGEGLKYALILQKVIAWFDYSIALFKEHEIFLEFYWYRRIAGKIIWALFREIERIMQVEPAITEEVITKEFSKICRELPYLP